MLTDKVLHSDICCPLWLPTYTWIYNWVWNCWSMLPFWTQVVVVAFPCAVIFGDCSTIHSPPALFLRVEIRSHTLISFLRPGSVHSGSVSWDDCGTSKEGLNSMRFWTRWRMTEWYLTSSTSHGHANQILRLICWAKSIDCERVATGPPNCSLSPTAVGWVWLLKTSKVGLDAQGAFATMIHV